MTQNDLIAYYDHFDEDQRLKDAFGQLEEAHTRRLILNNMPSDKATIFDIGAGTGPYSSWLASLGYQVHYSDLVPKHVALFRSRQGSAANILSVGVEDARQLSYPSDSADLIILNGPLYHLPERAHRLQVLREAKRVLKEGGRVLGFTISRFAGLNYALASGQLFNDAYFQMMCHELQTGYRENKALTVNTFSQAYFHLIDEIEAEFAESGLQVSHSAGVVGPSWNVPDLASAVSDPIKKERLVVVAELMEKYPMQSPKLLTIGIKKEP